MVCWLVARHLPRLWREANHGPPWTWRTRTAELAPGTQGEVCVQGDTVMARYWGNPEATAEALAGGWLRTGDIGVRTRADACLRANSVRATLSQPGEDNSEQHSSPHRGGELQASWTRTGT
jgi:hypothetical protein